MARTRVGAARRYLRALSFFESPAARAFAVLANRGDRIALIDVAPVGQSYEDDVIILALSSGRLSFVRDVP